MTKWNGPEPTLWRGEKITIGHFDDWSVVFFGDELVHWHDTPSCGQMLSLLGIDYDDIEVDRHQFLTEDMPTTLSGLKKAISDHERQEILAKKAELEQQIAALDAQLSEGE